MLDFFRRKAQSPYFQATVVIIALVFIFWGVGTNQGGGRNSIAAVNDQVITLQEFDKAYDRTQDQYRAQFGGSLPEGFVEAFGLKRQVLDQLIQQALIRQGALDMGLYVSDEEIQNEIITMPVFLDNKVFDKDRYNEVLRSSRLTPKKFETSVRSDLVGSKVLNHLAAFGHVLDSELEERYQFDNEERQLDYVVFKAADFKDMVDINDENLADFFQKYENDYRTDPQVKMKYLTFIIEDEIEGMTIDPQDLENYYQQHMEKYGQPEQRRARHILLKSTKGVEADKLQEKMEGILKKARAGEDFSTLARQFSEDGSASQGGDLGFFGRGRMVPAFETTAFSLNEGEISDIFQTSFGFHIMKLEKIKPAVTKNFTEVQDGIENLLKQERAKTQVFKKANETYEKIILSGSLAKYAADGGMPISQADFFARTSPPAALASNRNLIDTAFTLKKGELSSLIESPQGYGIIFVEDFKAPQVPPLENVTADVEKDFVAAQSLKNAREAADTFLAAVAEADNFQTFSQEQEKEVKESEFFSRVSQNSQGLPASIITGAFQLTEKQPLPKKIGEEQKNFYVYHLKTIKSPTEEEFAKSKEMLQNSISRENQINIMSAWMDHLRSRAEITVNQQFLQ